jgi:hypothetical protein
MGAVGNAAELPGWLARVHEVLIDMFDTLFFFGMNPLLETPMIEHTSTTAKYPEPQMQCEFYHILICKVMGAVGNAAELPGWLARVHEVLIDMFDTLFFFGIY